MKANEPCEAADMIIIQHRLLLLAALCLLLLGYAPSAAFAHHGWSWTTGENIELTGTITEASLGNPHGRLTLDVDGTAWTVEVGQPWRNERAGLKEGDLAEGVDIRVLGAPSANQDEKRLKAVRLWIGDNEYTLYPDRV
ncbi:hypothetical protein L861_06845 [Litchfieldella anticariensis FP35 = DSM 16096]|uniref:Uncharacterized protein n=2 Tax=Litchfieldella anticariensis TaxID=258591 RepID=S2KXR8_LITA3|nr:hypothetical protein L861_06845 [Halomonas anticariensis FP35 = DSM 16096]